MTTVAEALQASLIPKEQPFVETVKVALFGEYGTRKTLQIGNLIEAHGPEKVLILSAEHGLGTIRTKLQADRVIVVNSMDDIRNAWRRIKEEAETRHGLWLCPDGMSRVMDWSANVHLAAADEYANQIALGAHHEEIPARLKPYKRFVNSDGGVDTMKVYGLIGRDAELFLSELVKLPCNLYATYLADMTVNDRKKTIPWLVDVPGNVGFKAVMSTFDVVGFLGYKSDGQFYAGFDPKSKLYRARTRDDWFDKQIPGEIPDFNLATFATEYLVTKKGK